VKGTANDIIWYNGNIHINYYYDHHRDLRSKREVVTKEGINMKKIKWKHFNTDSHASAKIGPINLHVDKFYTLGSTKTQYWAAYTYVDGVFGTIKDKESLEDVVEGIRESAICLGVDFPTD
jgi:hypothetical protein